MRRASRSPRRSGLTTLAVLAGLVLAVLVGALSTSGTAEAHADLVRSYPAQGDVLPRSPQRVEITFSEEVAVAQSDIQVLDVDGNRVDLGNVRAVEGDPLTLRVGVPEDLAEGAYTVVWSNLSTVDGHTFSGSFVFFIGSSASFPAPPAADTTASDAEGIPIGEPLTRWGVLLGLVLLSGVPWMFGLVLAGTAAPEDVRPLRRKVERLAVAGGVLVLAAGAVQLALKMNETGGDLSLVTDTRWGNGWAIRTALATIATAGYAAGTHRLPRHARPVLVVLAILAAISVSLTSHGAAFEDFALVAGLVDATHILATMAWGGGLVAFLVLARHERGRPERPQSGVLRAAIPRFAVLGGLATLTLAITGTYAAWLHVGSLDAVATRYGWGVTLKVLLLATLVTVAAINTSWVRRRVAHPREVTSGATWLRRLLIAEVSLIAVVLLASATITSIEPARQQRAAEERAEGIVTVTEDAGLTIRSALHPGEVGRNTLTVELSRGGEPYEDATDVQLRFLNLEAALSASTVALEPSEDEPGTWTLPQPALITVDGLYEFAIRVQWPEGLDARQVVRIETGVDRATSLVDPGTAWWVGIVVLVAVGTAMIVANLLAARRRAVRGEILGWVGAGMVAGALLLWGRAPEDVGVAANPIPATSESLAQGAEIYDNNCVRCHGTEFDGNGPDAGNLPVPPSDLVLHFPQHPDGQHFAVISNGRPQSGMPAWEDALTEEQIWHVINFLRAETEERAPTLQAP